MRAYYNDNEPTCVAWLKELIRERLIPDGDVDDRSVHDVEAKDLQGYAQAHFFAGIGGWAYALGLANWPADEPVWTGSCPCQPYSTAGKGTGDDDPRNLWPVWRGLVRKCRPATVFGEQVASPAGRRWLAGVRADLEAVGYVVGAADLCAAGVGAPHIRQRLWWVGESNCRRWPTREQTATALGHRHPPFAAGGVGGLADVTKTRWEGRRGASQATFPTEVAPKLRRHGPVGRMDHSTGSRAVEPGTTKPQGYRAHNGVSRPASVWSESAFVQCRDGKVRRVEPGVSPLAARLPGDVDLLRATGNSVVPQVAAEFIKAYREAHIAEAGC